MLGKEKWIVVVFEKVFLWKMFGVVATEGEMGEKGWFCSEGSVTWHCFLCSTIWPHSRTWPPHGFSYSFPISCNLAIFCNLQAMITA